MRVSRKIILVSAMLLLILVLPKGAKAQVVTNSWGPDMKFTWSLDTTTKVLTISGQGSPEEGESETPDGGLKYNESSPWGEYIDKIETVVINDGLTTIPTALFSNNMKLKTITIPSTVTMIGDFAFYGDSSLKEIQIPDGIEKIGKEAFFNCDKLEKVTFGSGLKEMGTHVFAGCTSIKEVIVPEANEKFCSENGILFSKDKSILYVYPIANSDTYVIPDTVKQIDDLAFAWNDRLSEVTIGANVELIGGGAFYNCKNLKKVTFSRYSKLKKIRDFRKNYGDDYEENFGAFSGCSKLKEISLPDSLEQMDTACFHKCNSIEKIRFGSGIKQFVDRSVYKGRKVFYFEGGKNLKSIQVAKENPYFSTKDGVLYNKDKTKLCYYPAGKTNKKYVIPSDVKEILDYACSDAKNLVTITMGQKVTKIGKVAFAGCTGLKSMKLSAKLALIEDYAFSDCKNLQEITIQGKNTIIGLRAFYECKGLKKIILKDGIKKIGDGAFYVTGQSKLKTIYIPKSVTSIGSKGIGYHYVNYRDKKGNTWGKNEVVKNIIIYGKKNSAAEKYAKKNKIRFKRI